MFIYQCTVLLQCTFESELSKVNSVKPFKMNQSSSKHLLCAVASCFCSVPFFPVFRPGPVPQQTPKAHAVSSSFFISPTSCVRCIGAHNGNRQEPESLHCDARCPASLDVHPPIRRLHRSDRRLTFAEGSPIAAFTKEDRPLAVSLCRGSPHSPKRIAAFAEEGRRVCSPDVVHCCRSLARRPLPSLVHLVERIAGRPTPRKQKARSEQSAAQKSAEDLAVFGQRIYSRLLKMPRKTFPSFLYLTRVVTQC